ncbi:CynX/NimT family MFS transporter [Enterococcus ureasiticus]|uniref:MFS transporter n=1 Tax=Enterococcus ureasiticus TaxID=903984 RepID=A0A1E5GDT3_9ENTE|nr:MFS transporter [Enterococcus ureasiticus]OEG10852.1 MFS transporter [Enterococcus ureasiticus]
MKKEDRKKVGLVFLVAFSLRVGISTIPPLLPMLQKQLMISDVAASLLTSIPVICMGIFALSVPFVQQKLGRKKGILVFLLVLSLAIFLRALTSNYVGLISTAFLIGVATAIIGPLLSGYIKSEFPNNSGLLIGIYSLSMGLGASISSGSITSLTSYFNGRWTFALAIFGIFALIGFFCWGKGATVDGENKGIKQKVSLPLKNRQAWKITFFFGTQSGIFYGVTTWISTIAFSRGVSIAVASYVLTFYTLSQMFFSFVIPMLMDYRGKIKSWAFFSSLMVVLGIVGLMIKGPFWFFICATFLIAAGLGGLFPIGLLLPLKLTHSPEETSAWTGMVQSFGYMIGGCIPILMGVVSECFAVENASLWFVLILSLFIVFLTSILKKI